MARRLFRIPRSEIHFEPYCLGARSGVHQTGVPTTEGGALIGLLCKSPLRPTLSDREFRRETCCSRAVSTPGHSTAAPAVGSAARETGVSSMELTRRSQP